ncbi:hypothetical protein [Streptomyces sp. LaPpAH-108]|uniref:hypothetical protein n=1 Tax=Streptomyces sp. LaPpAH-108 TaxID=1155714 RepID=UPI000362460E|nr:hypothetical protein [Streptomyces sp. LaPpAH-108]
MGVRARTWVLLAVCGGAALGFGGTAGATGAAAAGSSSVKVSGTVPLPARAARSGPAPATAPRPATPPHADLSFHGHAVLTGDRVEVRLTPRDAGPSAVADASVRLRWSVALAERQELPSACARTGERTLVCGTGALAVGRAGRTLALTVALRQAASEVTLEVEPAWNGGVSDPDRSNDRLKVLVLDTGDAYAF